MSKLNITLIKSPIDKSKRQKATLKALGFTKMHQTKLHNDTPQLQGMIRVVGHLVSIENA